MIDEKNTLRNNQEESKQSKDFGSAMPMALGIGVVVGILTNNLPICIALGCALGAGVEFRMKKSKK